MSWRCIREPHISRDEFGHDESGDHLMRRVAQVGDIVRVAIPGRGVSARYRVADIEDGDQPRAVLVPFKPSTVLADPADLIVEVSA